MSQEVSSFHVNEGQDFSLLYNVTSYPDSKKIIWSRSRDGLKYVRIGGCSEDGCESTVSVRKIHITHTSFEIKNLQFPEDNDFYYNCNASNGYGNDSKVFRLLVYGNAKHVTYNFKPYMQRFTRGKRVKKIVFSSEDDCSLVEK